MWELDCEESWAPKNWCFWTAVFEKTLESPLDCKEIHQSILKEISPGVSLEEMMLRLELQYFGHLIWRVNSLEKILMLGEIAEKRTAEDEIAGYHHQLDGHESEWTPGVGDKQGCLVCCYSWGRTKSETTERLNWTELLTNKIPGWFIIIVLWYNELIPYENYTKDLFNNIHSMQFQVGFVPQ